MKSLYLETEKFHSDAVVGKVWGYEVWHFNTPTLCMKTLVIYPGFSCSYHAHLLKYEIFTCLDSGPTNRLYITIGECPERLLKRGDHVTIETGVKHTFRCEGNSSAALLELSTHHREDDSYREWSSHGYMGENSMEFMGQVGRLKGKKVVTVGDVALDEYQTGIASGLSPEAPVPNIDLDPYAPDITHSPGCAANVAANVVALGGEAFVVSTIGDDANGETLSELLRQRTITTDYLVRSSKRPTTFKSRIMAGTHHICRVQREVKDDLGGEGEDAILTAYYNAVDNEKPDVIYMADYDKGVLTPKVIARVIGYAHENSLSVIADPKIAHFHDYHLVDILKPNDVRAGVAMGMPVRTNSEVSALAEAIGGSLKCTWTLITRGGKGMYLYSEENVIEEHIPAIYVEVSELSGAGDTAGACLALGVASGMTVHEAASLSNVAASIVVQKSGTAFCTPTELAEVVAQM